MGANIVKFPGSGEQDGLGKDPDMAVLYAESADELLDLFDEAQLLQFTVTLKDVDVPTWRRFIIPTELTLDGLHSVIFLLFGWGGGHYYYFRKKDTFYDDPQLIEGNDVPYPKGETHVSAAETPIADAFPRRGSKLEYTYDLGDCWDFEVRLEERLTGAEFPFDLIPLCTGGAGANPPEDVGGAGGYARFCEAVNDPEDPEHDQMADWAGLDEDEGWDPGFFTVMDANETFAGIMVEGAADMLVPEDPDELRDAFIGLLAEKIARQASDDLVMDYILSRYAEDEG